MISDCVDCIDSVSCTWANSVPEGVVVFGDESDSKEWDEDGGIIHIIKEENFIFLEKVENEPCTLKINLNDSFAQITNISVVSEGRLIELYGKYGEYIKTCKCEQISEANGRKYYGAQTELLTSQEISFKFPGVKTGIWLCGIKILIRNVPPSITSSFDYNLVDDKLRKSNIPITEKAEQFKNFLHNYAMSKCSTTANMDPHTFLKIMEGECMSHLRPVESAGRNISKYFSNFLPLLKARESSNDRKEQDAPENGNQVPVQNAVKEYIDERFQKLEEKLEENFTKQLKDLESKQNEKLDAIIALLKSSTM